MSGVAIEKHTQQPALETISRLRQQLATIQTFDDINDLSAQVAAFEVYAAAKGSRELTDNAVEARCWIERRAGQLLLAYLERSKETWKAGYHNAEISASVGERWRLLGSVDDELLEATLSDIREKRELTIRGVLALLSERAAVRVESGIWKYPWGGYQIRTSTSGGGQRRRFVNPRNQTSQATLAMARRALAVEKQGNRAALRLKVEALRRNEIPDLRSAYSELRKCLAHLDRCLPQLNSEAREVAEEAMSNLHRAEDQLGVAMKRQNL